MDVDFSVVPDGADILAGLEDVINGCFYEGVFFAVAFHFYLPYFS